MNQNQKRKWITQNNMKIKKGKKKGNSIMKYIQIIFFP